MTDRKNQIKQTSKLTQGEQLVKLETILLQVVDELQGIKKDLNEKYITKERYESDLEIVNASIKRTKGEVQEVNSKRWVQNTLSAIFGAIISLLIAYFIGNVGFQ